MEPKIGRYRWTICSLVFFATTINYLDRAVISLLKSTLTTELKWDDADYTNVEIAFKVSYAIGLLLAGRFIDKVGTKKGYAWATGLWSIAAVLHAAAKSVFGLMDEPSEIDRGSKLINRAKGHIKISDLTFKYQNSKHNILEGINLIIKPGEKVALVGKSGGGKTTLINLLPRFYQIDQGKIFLDGININDLKLKNLRSQFSLVSQDTILFNDTIMNNIAYGNLERPVSEEEVKKAAIAANAWEFIDPLPNKLDHEIGDRGVRLSGGQRQRISIARAILKNAPILLLDEATSALDSHSEKYVQSALDNLMKNRTTIVIAHRLSTILNADRIVVIEKSKVIDVGTHAELIRRCKHYSTLYKKGLK